MPPCDSSANIRTVVHFITARRLVVPSSNLLSFIYCPAPSTFSRLALIFSDNSPDTSSKSLTSLLLLTTWYLKENLLEFIDLIGKSLIDGKTSVHALEVSKSNVRPRHKVGDVYAGMSIFFEKKKERQKSEEGGSLFIYLFFALGKQSVAILRTLLRNIKKKIGQT